jgi:hypothetical protein
LKEEDLLKQKGLENNVTKAHSFENLSVNERLPLQNSAKAMDITDENSTKNEKLKSFVNQVDKEKVPLQNSAKPPTTNSQIDSRKEIADFANTSRDTVMKVKEIKKDMPAEVKNDMENKINSGDISINQAHKVVRSVKNNPNAGEHDP